ncbi:MAG: hypothetical protein ABJC63_12480 [Gemmatimonadales bacterium]
MTAAAKRSTAADRNAVRIGRIVIIGAAIIEAIVISLAFFQKLGHSVR